MRFVAVAIAVVMTLVSLLGYRLYEQDALAHGPIGGSGVIEGTSIAVSSRLSARVTGVKVKEGQEVKEGDILLTLDCADPEAALSEAQARLEVAKATADAAKAGASASRHSGAATAAAARAAKAQAKALEAQRDAAKRQMERLEALGADIPVASRDSAAAQAQALAQQAAGAAQSGEATGLQVSATKAQATAAEAQAIAAAEGVKAAEAAVARARLLAAECVVKAPSPGLVETLPFHEGELVPPGAVLSRLVDLREVTATVYVPNAEIGGVKAGSVAILEADAWPGERFEGRVSTVTMTAAFTPRNIQTRSDRDRLVYPVEVVVNNALQRLRPGMPVQVTLEGTEH